MNTGALDAVERALKRMRDDSAATVNNAVHRVKQLESRMKELGRVNDLLEKRNSDLVEQAGDLRQKLGVSQTTLEMALSRLESDLPSE